MPGNLKDYYKILGVQSDAREDAIKKSYRQKAKELHPDLNKSPLADSYFALLNEAYHTLIDPEKRRKYDLQVQRHLAGQPEIRERRRRNYDYRRRKSDSYYNFVRNIKKERKVTLLDKILFTTMVIIGIAFFVFSIIDLLSDSYDKFLNGLSGLLGSICFLIILIYGWRLYTQRT